MQKILAAILFAFTGVVYAQGNILLCVLKDQMIQTGFLNALCRASTPPSLPQGVKLWMQKIPISQI